MELITITFDPASFIAGTFIGALITVFLLLFVWASM